MGLPHLQESQRRSSVFGGLQVQVEPDKYSELSSKALNVVHAILLKSLNHFRMSQRGSSLALMSNWCKGNLPVQQNRYTINTILTSFYVSYTGGLIPISAASPTELKPIASSIFEIAYYGRQKCRKKAGTGHFFSIAPLKIDSLLKFR